MALARRLGLDTATVADALGGGPLVSPWQEAKLRRVADGEYSAQFALSLALKDVRLALQAAGDDRLAVLACLADEWQRAADQGLDGEDLTVVTRDRTAARRRARPDQAPPCHRGDPGRARAEASARRSRWPTSPVGNQDLGAHQPDLDA